MSTSLLLTSTNAPLSLVTIYIQMMIVFGLMLRHTVLSHEAAMELWNLALNSSWATVLYRD